MDRDTHTASASGGAAGGGVEARRAWLLSKKELRAQFGEGAYQSYIEPLDFAVEEDEAHVFWARNGGTQSDWLNEKAREPIARRMMAHTKVYKPIRICVMRELSPRALEAVQARPVEAPAAEIPAVLARPAWKGDFRDLCEGPANTKAVMLGRLIAQRSAGLRMVLFRGEPGVGKTLLVEAIANEALCNNPDLRVRLINGQRFTEDFVDALNRKRDTSAFKAFVREADLLIIDDVPRVAGRKHTEEELYDAIVSVWDRGGFVILTAVTGQSGVAAFGDRLAHHLKCATECEIALPDEDLRRRILDARVRHYAEGHPTFAVSGEALDMIAAKMPVSGRELDGAVSQLLLDWLASDRSPVQLEAAENTLRTKISERERKVTADMIKAAVARHFQMSVAELLRKTREKAVSHPRQVAMYLCSKQTTLSLPNLARLCGGYDHTTVLYAKRVVPKRIAKEPELGRDIEEIMKLLRQWPSSNAN